METKPGVESLANWQRRFKDAVTATEAPEDLSPLALAETAVFPRAERLEVYRHAFQARMEYGLSADFPRVAEILGDEDFARVSLSYCQAYPSRYASMEEIGTSFADYLKSAFPGRPELTAVAELEWLHLRSNWAEDRPSFDFALLASLDEAAQAHLRLRLQPYVFFLRSRYALDGDDEVPALEAQESVYLIHRVGHEVRTRRLDAAAARVLEDLHAPQSIESIAGWLSDANVEPAQATQWFSEWASWGLLAHERETTLHTGA